MPSRRYKVVFFDFGGTLGWAESRADVIWTKALEEHGYRVTPEEIVEKAGARGPEINRGDLIHALDRTEEEFQASFPSPQEEAAFFRRHDAALLRRLGLSPEEPILDTVQRLFQEVVIHLFEDVHPTLTRLREEGYRLGIISNASHDLPGRMEDLDLARHFESITYSYAVGAEKPNPTIFHVALNAMEVRPEEAVHVGDNPEADARGASAVGMTPMLIDRRGRHREAEFIVLRNLGEILDHLLAGGTRKGS